MNDERQRRLPAVVFAIGKLIGCEPDPGVLIARTAELIGQLLDDDPELEDRDRGCPGAVRVLRGAARPLCTVMLVDGERRRLLAKASPGPRPERPHWLSVPLDHGIAGWVMRQGKPALIDDVTVDPRFAASLAGEPHARAMLCVPLIAHGDCIGVITASAARPGAFGPDDVELIRQVAVTISLDIEHVRRHRVAVTDPLTGAYNRDFLHQHLPHEIEAATERDRPLSLALVDVDHFKTVNDRYGHSVGDAVLSEVGRRLRGAIRTDDLLVRYGGEEFLAVLPMTDAGRAWELGERMRQRVSERAFDLGDGLALLLRVSVGVAQWRTGELMPALIERTGAALHGAKNRGRNRVEVSP